MVVYALAGMQQFVLGSYFVGTLSTMEKIFNMSSKMSGTYMIPISSKNPYLRESIRKCIFSEINIPLNLNLQDLSHVPGILVV